MVKSFDDRDLESFLGSVPLFQDLPPEAIAEATNRLKLRQHPPDKLLLIEEDWGNSVYLVVQGWVKIRTYNYDGKEITLNILGPGDIFGEMALLLSSPRSTDVLSLTAVVIGSLPADDFMTLVKSSHVVGLNLAKMMAKRLQQVNRRLRMRQADSVARLADVLLFLAEGRGKSSAVGVAIPILTHQELAGLCGLSRETVTRSMSKLEKKGIIERSDRDSIYVPNLLALEKLLS
ncbi:MAG TPA: hypothetical protein DEV81_03840 [Cyanobacteria bacterium UBA11049]|nr:hypothetical protein [Cyanobacteria bacterium UBA11049]